MRASRHELPELLGAAIRGSDWGDLRATVISMPSGYRRQATVQGTTRRSLPRPTLGLCHQRSDPNNLRRP